MKVLVFGYKYKEADKKYIKQVFDKLEKEDIATYVFSPYYSEIEKELELSKNICAISSYDELKESKLDFVITLGGDGTILRAVSEIRDSKVPIMGINLERLGFLSSIEKKLIEDAIDKLIEGTYTVEERKMVQVESNIPIFGDMDFGLNDFTLHKRDTSSMMVIHAYVNGDFLNSYWADGLLVSTPTGSTGYSLSCGGPVVLPHSSNFIVSPVCPHNLNVRPLVVSDDSELTFEVVGRDKNIMLSLDSRSKIVTSSIKISIKKQYYKVKIVKTKEYSYLSTLRNKLNWGTDVRN